MGYRIAKASPDIAHLGEYILKHHEWWNGMGYPFGLKGEDILLN
ncbi:HD domain-containing phosphohydrolase [Clostridium homopropionicum]